MLAASSTTTSIHSTSYIPAAPQRHHRHRHVVANGDEVTDPERYPYFARIDFDGIQGCGGTLIHPEFVLTAAHCFDASLEETVTVFLGTLDGFDFDPAKQAVVQQIILHPNWDIFDTLFPNDIALIQVDPIDFADPVALNTNDVQGTRLVLKDGDPVTVFGFGMDETQTFPHTLQEGAMFITSDEQCQVEDVEYGGIDGPSMICALDAQERQDSCVGDSGGPLIVSGGSADKDVQVGVVSSGIDAECGQNQAAGVYTEIAYFHDWIQFAICEHATMSSAITCGNLTVDPASFTSSAGAPGGMKAMIMGDNANSVFLQVVSLLALACSSFLLSM